jgi:superfamily II RNA helicase
MEYDRFQKEAIGHINDGCSVIVSAPTGAGKTAIAEHVISESIRNNIKVIYTAPIKALSNQKFRDFQERFGAHIGILTGDVSLNAHANVLIMTTEIFRNKILDDPTSLKDYSWAIFDEIHYIDNPERGTVWEEALMFLPAHMKMLGLSATIPNIDQLACWIQRIHKQPVRIVVEKKRPVPLHLFYQCHNEIVDDINALKKLRRVTPNKLNTLIDHLRQKNGLPCIYFVFGRRRAEDLAFDLYGYNFLDANQKARITQMYDDLCVRYDLKNERSAKRLYPLIQRGIGYHHAGMLPALKEVIERLFCSRLLKVIFTTETFALGINMPSRSVVFDGLEKFYGRYTRILKTRDFYQMAGRAGRRGIDKEGFAYTRANLHRIRPDEIKRIVYSEPEEVKSQFNLSYAAVLNLYEKCKEALFDAYLSSLHYFQSKKHQQKEATRLIQARLDLLKDLGYIEIGGLTQKGLFAKTIYGYELVLSELYCSGALDVLDESGLAVLSVACVFEPRKNQRMPAISKASRRVLTACEEVRNKIKHEESRRRIYPSSKLPYFNLANAVEAWVKGEGFEKVLQFTDTDEGEVVRYLRMAIQILKEMIDAQGASAALKERLRNTVRLINRDVVDAEKQLIR